MSPRGPIVPYRKPTYRSECFGGSQPTPWAARQYAALCHALLKAHDARAHERPSVPVKLGAEVAYNQHFSSLHAAAAGVADAWRLFSRVSRAADAHRSGAEYTAAYDDAVSAAEEMDRSALLLRQLRDLAPPDGHGGAPAAAEDGDAQRGACSSSRGHCRGGAAA